MNPNLGRGSLNIAVAAVGKDSFMREEWFSTIAQAIVEVMVVQHVFLHCTGEANFRPL